MPDFDLRMVLQIGGALLCIANYILIQTRRLSATQNKSLLIVAFGGGVLLASAIMGADWGLIMLEVSWLLMVSITLMVRRREALAAAAAAAAASAAALAATVEFEAVLGSTAELDLVGAGDSLHL